MTNIDDDPATVAAAALRQQRGDFHHGPAVVTGLLLEVLQREATVLSPLAQGLLSQALAGYQRQRDVHLDTLCHWAKRVVEPEWRRAAGTVSTMAIMHHVEHILEALSLLDPIPTVVAAPDPREKVRVAAEAVFRPIARPQHIPPTTPGTIPSPPNSNTKGTLAYTIKQCFDESGPEYAALRASVEGLQGEDELMAMR